MGVEGLLSVAQHLRDVFTYNVVNEDLDEDYDYRYFLFDGTSWLWNVYVIMFKYAHSQSHQFILYRMKGNILMDFGSARKRAKVMVDRFRKCGLDLIVFIDANITNNKQDTWLSRRAQRVENLYAINNRIKSTKGDIHGYQFIWYASAGSYFFCGQIFESLGCKVIYAHIDCDREMYGYYLMNKPFMKINGVIGFDTDFLIFNFPIYLELTSMKWKPKEMLIFNGYQHYKLLNRLHCKQRHLPRIASIMGCDVTRRLQTCSGNIDYAAKIVKDIEEAEKRENARKEQQKQNGTKSGAVSNLKKKKKIRNGYGIFGEHGGLKKRFGLADTFYSGIFPMDILFHTYPIMLLFQDYHERSDKVCVKPDKKEILNKSGSPYYYIRGLKLDMSMDDADLIKNPKEASSIATMDLRKWLYRYFLRDLKELQTQNEDEKELDAYGKMLSKKGLRIKELICYAAPRLCFREDMTKREWLKGISVILWEKDEEDDITKNPLFQLQSYKFVKNVIEMEREQKTNNDENDNKNSTEDENESESEEDEALVVEIPEEYIVKDIIYLLTYLRDLDANRNREPSKQENENEENAQNENETEREEKKEEQSLDTDEVKENNQETQQQERVPFVFGVSNSDAIKSTHENGTQDNDDDNAQNNNGSGWSTKKSKKKAKSKGKKKRGKRGAKKKKGNGIGNGNKKKNDSSNSKSTSTDSQSNQQNDDTKTEIIQEIENKPAPKQQAKNKGKSQQKKQNKHKGLKIWGGYTTFIDAFLWQWKFRDVFIKCNNYQGDAEIEMKQSEHKQKANCPKDYRCFECDELGHWIMDCPLRINNKQNDRKNMQNKHGAFESQSARIKARSMHYRSILFSVYEIIYTFLSVEFECKWFPSYYCEFLRNHYNREHDKQQNHQRHFRNIPKLHLLNGIDCDLNASFNEDCECSNCKIRDNIQSWKDEIINKDNQERVELDIPYVWEILNTKLFHWIWSHHSKTKSWINECRPNEL